MSSRLPVIYGSIILVVVAAYLFVFVTESTWNPIQLRDMRLPSHPSGESVQVGSGPRILNLWAGWCQVCEGETDILNKLVSQNMNVLGVISQDGVTKDISEKVKRRHFLSLHDKQSKLFNKIEAKGVPTTLLLNQKGEVVFRIDGALSGRAYTVLMKKYKELN